MTSISPQIDLRTQTELASQIQKLLLQYCPEVWVETDEVCSDKWADSLIQIYARMMEVVIQHINRVPDKNFLNFLDTMGIGPLPPRPAQTALVFSLAKGAPSYAKVPAGTQVAAKESPDGKPVVFETNKDLVAIKPKVIRAWSISPDEDKYTNHSEAFFNPESEDYEKQQILLKGDELLPHRLYIGGGDSFAFEEPTDIELEITFLEEISQENGWKLKWFTYTEDSPEPVEIEPYKKNSGETKLKVENITFANVPVIAEKMLKGYGQKDGKEFQITNRWIYAELRIPLPELNVLKLDDGIEQEFEKGELVTQIIPGSDPNKIIQYPLAEDAAEGVNKIVVSKIEAGDILNIDPTGINESVKVIEAYQNIIITEPIKESDGFIANTVVSVKEKNIKTYLSSDIAKDSTLLTVAFFEIGEQNEIAISDTILTIQSVDKLPGIESVKVKIPFQFSNGSGLIDSDMDDSRVLNGVENTKFQTELLVGDVIVITDDNTEQKRMITAIEGVNSLTVHQSVDISNKPYSYFTPFLPELSFYNNFPLDVTKDFLPFGEKPKFADTFYIGSQEVFSKVGSCVNIFVALTPDESKKPDTKSISLKWEYWDGKTWSMIGETKKTNGSSVTIGSFSDSTDAFTQNGTIEFICPQTELRKINGEENYWIRIRITGGDYGEEAKSVEITKVGGWKVEWRDDIKKKYQKQEDGTYEWVPLDGTDEIIWDYYPATYKPPVVQIWTLSYEPVFIAPDAITLHNNFFYENVNKKKELASNVFERFIPFKTIGEEEDVLYFAFDTDISSLPVVLFYPLITEVSAVSSGDVKQEPPSLKWEYWTGSKWGAISVEDGTKELTRRGMASLLIPEDCKQIPRFEENKYWIRARLEKGVYDVLPRLTSVHTNAVWAKNLVTVPEEILGSGNGTPGQQINFSNSPLLTGQQVFVREAELTAEEKSNIIELEGDDALQPIKQETGIAENWVRWHEVNHLWYSDPHSRTYIIDRENGSITFGDGKRGMIPQAGRNNIKAEPYKYGGGLRGNVKKSQLTKLRKAIPYIDSVFNPVDAEGGTDVEDMTQIRDRGPRSIRHRNKAVTLTDYEWIVQEASPKIAKVKGLSVTNPQKQFRPGWITMMVLPYSDDVKPLPSAELISDVTTYLSSKAMTCLTDEVELQQINIIPPNYLRIDADAKIVVKNISDVKEAESLVFQKFVQFFHPITGGPANAGWEFGRGVYKSEIYEALEGIEKVDYVFGVVLKASEQLYEINVKGSIKATINFPDHSIVRFDENITLLLAQTIQKGTVTRMKVFGFMEGDHIELRHEVTEDGEIKIVKKIRMFVQNVEDVVDENKCVISCSPVRVEESFPATSGNERTIVETFLKPDGQEITSYLVADTSDNEISQIEIVMPKAGDAFTVTHRDWRSSIISGTVQDLINTIDNIFLEKEYLVYSGTHKVRAYLEENIWDEEPIDEVETETVVSDIEGKVLQGFQYLVNTNSGEVHDMSNIKQRCNLSLMKDEHKRYIRSLEEIREELVDEIYDYCRWCFGEDMSKR